MASVAIPLVASFVVNKVGESQGWDPRMTAVLGAVAGFGAGSIYSAGTAVAASGAGTAGSNAAIAGHAATKAAGMGSALKAGSAAGASTFGNGLGQAGSMSTSVNPHGDWFAPDRLTNSWDGSLQSGAGHSSLSPMGSSDAPTNPWPQNYRVPQGGYSNGPRSIQNQFHRELYGNRNPGQVYTPGKKTTFPDALGNEIDKWKTRPTDDNGRETGYSPAENFGVSALKTLMKDLPPEAPVGGRGGGGGPTAPAYQGGGGGAKYQTVWSFGQPNQGYKPQGI